MNSPDSAATTVRQRITQLRAAMARHRIDAWIVGSADPHLSEYCPDRWLGREWLSGFTGSAGTLVVTAEFAGLWVDSRYWSQAEAQLAGTGIAMMKVNSAASAAHQDWLASQMKAGAVVGCDGATVGLASARALEGRLTAIGARLEAGCDLLEEVWHGRPGLPAAAVFEHLPPFAVATRKDKLAGIRNAMREAGASHHLISTLDDLAWLLNLRGADVPYNPVFLGHLLIGEDRAELFAGEGKIGPAIRGRLEADGVAIRPYDQAGTTIHALAAGSRLLIDPRRVTFGMVQAVPAGTRLVEAINPSTLAKSRKLPGEAAQVRLAMEQDGAALAEFFSEFEASMARGEPWSELTVDERLSAARAARPGFVSLSFPTIAGFNANGAMPHYRATPASFQAIAGDGLLLIDSGGQYLGGTTDITRVVAIGTPSAEQRHDFTQVLRGMMQLSRAAFPRGTRSALLDTLARAPIWQSGIDYGHGTGHGVGYFLNVHEGPQSISPAAPMEPQTGMEPGMITSNEPGIYRPGRWGVRIENLLLAVAGETTEFGEFLRFETLTLCPIDRRCIDTRLLRNEERDWLDAYHAEVARRLSPLLSGTALQWLERQTAPL